MSYLSRYTLASFWDFLKHPVTALVVGLITAAIPYIPSRSGKELYYAVSIKVEGHGIPYLLNLKSKDKIGVRLRIAFLPIKGGKKDDRKRSYVHIAIWNSGASPIKWDDIAKFNPVRIKPSGKVKIDDVMVFKKSRPDLQLETYIQSGADNIEEVIVGIKEGEALEKFDGAGFLLSYIKEKEENIIDWKVIGRLIGINEPFNLMEWSKVRWKYERSWYLRWIPPIGNGYVLFYASRTIYRHKKRGTSRRFIVPYIVFLTCFCIAVFITIYEEYLFTAIPSWLYEVQAIAW